MNIFKKAHELTKQIIKEGDDYRATFAECVKYIWEQKRNPLEILLGMGLKVWAKGGFKRIYINSTETFLQFAELAGLDKSTISMYCRFANRISSNKTWFDLKKNKFKSEKATVNTLFQLLEI